MASVGSSTAVALNQLIFAPSVVFPTHKCKAVLLRRLFVQSSVCACSRLADCRCGRGLYGFQWTITERTITEIRLLSVWPCHRPPLRAAAAEPAPPQQRLLPEAAALLLTLCNPSTAGASKTTSLRVSTCLLLCCTPSNLCCSAASRTLARACWCCARCPYRPLTHPPAAASNFPAAHRHHAAGLAAPAATPWRLHRLGALLATRPVLNCHGGSQLGAGPGGQPAVRAADQGAGKLPLLYQLTVGASSTMRGTCPGGAWCCGRQARPQPSAGLPWPVCTPALAAGAAPRAANNFGAPSHRDHPHPQPAGTGPTVGGGWCRSAACPAVTGRLGPPAACSLTARFLRAPRPHLQVCLRPHPARRLPGCLPVDRALQVGAGPAVPAFAAGSCS